VFKNIYKNKTVLITGDTGFKGSWLAIWLLKLGANVVGYGLKPKTDKDNYVICDLKNKITHIDGDIRNYDKFLSVFNVYNPEIVFHLAAQALVLDSYKDPINTYSTNLMGTIHMFEAVRRTPSVRVVVSITSDKCYENNEWIYGYRETDPMGGIDPYSASKGAAEIITSSYIRSFFNREEIASVASVRAGNVIGGGDWSENRIIPDCIKSLNNNEPIIIRNPNAVRPWQHVLEPLSGYLTVGSLLYTHGKKYSSPWNFAPSYKNIVSVKQLVEEIIKYHKDGKYIVRDDPNKKHESSLLCLDVSKAINILKWQPVFDFKQTVKFTMDEYLIEGFTKEEVYNQRLEHIEKYIQLRKELEE